MESISPDLWPSGVAANRMKIKWYSGRPNATTPSEHCTPKAK